MPKALTHDKALLVRMPAALLEALRAMAELQSEASGRYVSAASIMRRYQ